MQSFYIGLIGSLVGGSILASTVSVLFFYEKRKAKQVADKMVNDLKSIYQDKILDAKLAKVSSKIFN